jgi:hypothetical protein
VIHPAPYIYFRNDSKQDNAAATERETTKIRKYAELNAINPAPINYQFFPLVVESFGSCVQNNRPNREVWIGRPCCCRTTLPKISVTLQRFNASMILNRSPKTA